MEMVVRRIGQVLCIQSLLAGMSACPSDDNGGHHLRTWPADEQLLRRRAESNRDWPKAAPLKYSQLSGSAYRRRFLLDAGLPEDFQLCGMPDPTQQERVEMGKAAALSDVQRKADRSLDRNLQNEKLGTSNKEKKKKQNIRKKKQTDTNATAHKKEYHEDKFKRKYRKKKSGNRSSRKKRRQNRPGSTSKKKRAKKKKKKQSRQPRPEMELEVPVWFHVMRKNATYGDLSDGWIEADFVTSLKRAYASTPIKLKFEGITRTINETWFNCEDEIGFKTSNRKGGPETLNIFVCDMARARKLGGNAHLPPIVRTNPGYDGVTVMNPALGGALFAKQALVHESGHWFGLMHTFQDGCDAEPNDNYAPFKSFYFAGDGVADTPAHAVPTWNVTQHSYCWRRDELDTCKDKKGVDPGLDPIDNFMNYLPGNCFEQFGRFTEGQSRRMVAEYLTFRAG